MNDKVCRTGRNSAGVLLMVMITIVLAQVFYRYILDSSFSWTEELAKVLMVWVTFLVAPWAYRGGEFVSVDMFVDSFSKRFRQRLELIIHLVIMWALAVFFMESIDFWQKGQATMAATLPLALSWFYMIVPMSFLALICVGVELILRSVMIAVTGDQSFRLHEHGQE